MSINDQFLKFYENIKLTPLQREDAKIKYDGVCKKLHDYYYPTTEYTGDTKFLIGSYAKQTHIRPARDIDVIFIMPPEKFSQYGDNRSNCQSQLLQDIKRILEEKYPNTPIRADEKVVILEFADTRHDVELLPAWENSDGTFKIPNSKNGGSWEDWNPRLEIEKINDSDLATKKTKTLIRMIKKWSENCSAQIKSYKIENGVIDFFTVNTNYGLDYSTLAKNFFHYFFNVITDENLKSHLSTAGNRAQKACDFEGRGDLEKAIDEWEKIFGNDFPKTIKAVAGGVVEDEYSKLTKLQHEYPSSAEEFLTQKYGTPFEINPKYTALLDADITKQKGFQDTLLSIFLKKKLPVQKQKGLLFRVSHDVPRPYEIKWKVRNFGEEALRANGLRGEIYDDLGYETRRESTLYYGEHYVECYIIKDNKCVALGRILVPIGNNY